MKKQAGFVGATFLIVGLIVVAGGVYLQQKGKIDVSGVFNGKERASEAVTPVTTTERIAVDEHVAREGLDASIQIDADLTTTVSCGSKGCFEEKFRRCEPSTADFEIGGPVGALGYHYKIIGKTTRGCMVTTKYTKGMDPEWLNKEMTCAYDNSLTLDLAAEKVFDGIFDGTSSCSGPLFDLFTDA